MRLATLALGAAVVLSELVSAQKFYGTCDKDWYLDSGSSWMYATCRSKSGAKITSRLDLNACLGNNNGALVAREGGRFKGSCQDCKPDENTLTLSAPGVDELPPNISVNLPAASSILTCSCKLKTNMYNIGSTFDLNDVVGNDNGYLKCYNTRAERV